MLFAMNSIGIKERPESGVEAPTAKRTRPPLKAGAHGDEYRSCHLPHALGQAVILVWIGVGTQSMRCDFPVGGGGRGQHMLKGNQVILLMYPVPHMALLHFALLATILMPLLDKGSQGRLPVANFDCFQ
jgi:hypothetical protein